MSSPLSIAAIVGRPNVGKSTLFNRLIGRRSALVEKKPGITRDRNYGKAQYHGFEFIVVDTGGFEPVAETSLIQKMAQHAQLARCRVARHHCVQGALMVAANHHGVAKP